MSITTRNEPPGEATIFPVLDAFFQALTREDEPALTKLLTQDAVLLGAFGKGSRASLIEAFRSRMRNLDYTQLTAISLFSRDAVERSDYEHLRTYGPSPRPPEMRPRDVLVQVHISFSRIGSDRYFGNVMTLLLREEEHRLKIAGVGET